MMKVLAQIDSDTTERQYEIRVGNDYRAYCTCPAWKFSKGDPKQCKHLDRFMCGDFDFVGTTPVNRPVNTGVKPDGFSIRALLLN